jgi:hypothetical protein
MREGFPGGRSAILNCLGLGQVPTKHTEQKLAKGNKRGLGLPEVYLGGSSMQDARFFRVGNDSSGKAV